jgi:PAS domain S-box-containing protein
MLSLVSTLIYIQKDTGARVGLNRAWLVAAMNSSWRSFIHADDRIGAARQWFHSLATGGAYCADYRLRRQDGTYRHFTAAALPIRNRAGKILIWLGISEDVHEDKLAEQNRHRAAGLSSVR